MNESQFDQAVLREAFACFPSGVTAVCAMVDGAPVGMAASSFTSVSLDPALVSICVAHSSSTWPVLRGASRLGVSVLAQDHDNICRSLARKTGDRFAHVAWEANATGSVVVHGSTLWLECSVDSEILAGDHNIVVLRIHDVRPYPDIAPLVFHGSKFRQLNAEEPSLAGTR
jgi:flavin reductase (DIM6/NTAB) family NADH-FMN oxidoreductase RutF